MRIGEIIREGEWELPQWQPNPNYEPVPQQQPEKEPERIPEKVN